MNQASRNSDWEQLYRNWVEQRINANFMWRNRANENNRKTVVISSTIQKSGISTNAKILQDCNDSAFTEYCFSRLNDTLIKEIPDVCPAPVHIKCTFKETREISIEFLENEEMS